MTDIFCYRILIIIFNYQSHTLTAPIPKPSDVSMFLEYISWGLVSVVLLLSSLIPAVSMSTLISRRADTVTPAIA